MTNERSAPVFFFAPFVSSTMRIEPAWIDDNGHLNRAYYHVLFDRAVEEGFGVFGLGAEDSEERGASVVAAEAHVLYRRELKARDPVRVTLHLIDHDETRIHVYMELRHAGEGWVSASCEQLSLHVDGASRTAVPFPEDILRNLSVMKAAHGRLARPEALGRVIGMASRPEERDLSRATGTRH